MRVTILVIRNQGIEPMADQPTSPTANEILDSQVIYVKRGRLNKFGFEPAWNAYFDFYLSSKYLEKPILQLEDVTFHLWLRKNLNDEDPNWQIPSIRVMKRKFGISQDKIEAMLKRLTKAHLLKKVSGQGSGNKGENVTNTYELSDPIQSLDDFLVVAKTGEFPQPLKVEWRQYERNPVPEIGTGALPKIGTPPVPKTGTHKHTSSFQQTTIAMPKRENKNNNSGGDGKQNVVALTKLGITEKVAQRLASRHKEATINQQIDYHKYELATAPEKIKSPSGRLRTRIEENWAAPDGYTKDWRERLAAAEKAAEEARQEKRAFEASVVAQKDADRENQEKIRDEQLKPLLSHYSTSEREKNIWSGVIGDLGVISPASKALLAGSELLSLADGQAVIWLQNEFARDQMERQYALRIKRLLAKYLAIPYDDITITWLVPGSQSPP